MKRLTLVSTDLQCLYKWPLKSHTLSSWSLRETPDKESWISSKCEVAGKEPKSPGRFQNREQSQHQRQCLDDFNLRKNGFNTKLAMGIFVLAQIELKSNILHLQSKWLINSHRILFLLHNTLKKMNGFYYSTYYILSAKVKKMWFPPSLPSCKNERQCDYILLERDAIVENYKSYYFVWLAFFCLFVSNAKSRRFAIICVL